MRADAPEPPKPGDTFAGKYAIVRLVGEGGMARVYEARHVRLDTRVAIKILNAASAESPELVARFEREARAAVRLRSENVARIFDVDVLADGSPFMVMEYLEGCDLAAEMERRQRIPMSEAVGYILEACAALGEAHALGIVHRDITPGNLFLATRDRRRLVKILDFGISKVTSEAPSSVTKSQSTLGTPLYMSPEQVRSAKHVDGRSDLWSLGVILYQMLAGQPPFDGDTASAVFAAIAADPPAPLGELRPDLPAPLVLAVTKALSKDPAMRFPNVDAFAQALAEFGPSEGSEGRDPHDAEDQARAMRARDTTLSSDASGLVRPSAPRKLDRRFVAVALAGATGLVLVVVSLVASRPATPETLPAPPAPPPPLEAVVPRVDEPPVTSAEAPLPATPATTVTSPRPTVTKPDARPQRSAAAEAAPAPTREEAVAPAPATVAPSATAAPKPQPSAKRKWRTEL